MTSAASRTQHIIASVIIGLAVSLLAVAALFFNTAEEIENRTWDWRLRWIAQAPAHNPIRIINIDQASLDYLANQENIYWPWPRGIYEAPLRFLQRAGAKAVAFDILFTETSSYGVDDDETLSQAVADTLPVVSAVALRRSQVTESSEDVQKFSERMREAETKTPFAKKYLDAPVHTNYVSATLPITPLLEKSAGFGNVEGTPDSDGVFRHFIAGGFVEETPVLALPFALFHLVNPQAEVSLNSWFDDKGLLTTRFLGPKGTIPTYSFANIFLSWQNILADTAPLIPLEDFKDSYVLIGMDAPGLLDLRPTPLSPNFPGVEYNATILSNLLQNSFIQKLPFFWAAFFTVLLVMGTVGAVIQISKIQVQVSLVVGLAVALLLSSYCAAMSGVWTPLVVPSLALTLAAILGLLFQYSVEGRQHRFIRNAFRYYVSPNVIDKIVADPSNLSLGGEKRELTIFFSDIAGFTSISETIEPTRLVHLLNAYLTCITDVILASGGTVDKYVGDAVVAFWNAPLPVPDHASRGTGAAIECQKRLAEMQTYFKKEFGIEVKTRIGLNTGTVTVGNFGSKDRFNYTIVGDGANLASRLEGANKYFGTLILVADTTYEAIRTKIDCRKVADIKVVGRSRAVGVYEPLFEQHFMQEPAIRANFDKALQLFEKKELSAALEIFLTLARKDAVSRLYVSRIEKDLTKPASEWSPIWNLTEK